MAGFEWHDAREVAARTFGPQAVRAVERLLARGADLDEIGVYGVPDTDEDGWLYVGEGRVGGYKHPLYIKRCYVVGYLEDADIEVAVELTQMRYGRNGKVRAQPVRVGVPIWQDTLAFNDDPDNPQARAVWAALGMDADAYVATRPVG